MKKLTLAVAAALTVAAPAFAQDRTWNTPQDPYYQSRDQNRWAEREYRSYDDRVVRGDRDGDGMRDFARVIDSRPVYAQSARQECFNPRAGVYEEVREENRTRIGKGAAVGAVAGGVIGHQVDQGGGTAAGAILGGILGHHLERRNDRNEQNDLDFSRCRVLGDASGAQQGYEVRYVYDGREYTTFMNHEPGRRLRVGEDIRADGTPFHSGG